jgi:hypothetical protein
MDIILYLFVQHTDLYGVNFYPNYYCLWPNIRKLQSITSLLQATSTMLTKKLCSLASLNKNLSHQKKIMSTKSYYK